MASITGTNPDKFDFKGLTSYLLKGALPRYAIPLFLRFSQQQEVTSTFKHLKSDLKKEGFDITKVREKFLFCFYIYLIFLHHSSRTPCSSSTESRTFL